MNVEYIIVQAGGKGSRMEQLTKNKPKAMVPIRNLPMIFHLFRKFPKKKFIIIGDYKYDVLKNYLKAFADVDYKMICATGSNGTCSGIKEAIKLIPENEPLALIWCDLVLSNEFEFPFERKNYIGISKDFECRWKYEKDVFVEERSDKQGVAGFFIFDEKKWLEEVPKEGEFVRWLKNKNYIFTELPLRKTHEYGLYSEWSKLPITKCRPFNRIEISDDKLYKIPIDSQGISLAKREQAWYKALNGMHFESIPKIYAYDPLCMEYIDGDNIYKYKEIDEQKKKHILKEIIDCLKSVHKLASCEADINSYYEAYIGKTFDRLKKVRDLVPFAGNEYININGRKCRNVFNNKRELELAVMQYVPKCFVLIHGDCTFSNIMIKKDGTPVLIDPRGYFGKTELMGDPAYDWVKLYYSLFSNYDQFNLKKFDLTINDDSIQLFIESNNWECVETEFFRLLEDEKISRKQIKLLLAITWLSLTTYAWEDFDSICGAFYQGLYYLEEVL